MLDMLVSGSAYVQVALTARPGRSHPKNVAIHKAPVKNPVAIGDKKDYLPNSGESNRPLTPILLKSIAIHLPCLSRYSCKSMPSPWQKVAYTPPICITIRLPFVSRYFCRSIRVRGRWNTPTNFCTPGKLFRLFEVCQGRRN